MVSIRVFRSSVRPFSIKKYVDQIKEGDSYAVFKKCVSISILDFVLFKDETEFYSRFHISEDSTSNIPCSSL